MQRFLCGARAGSPWVIVVLVAMALPAAEGVLPEEYRSRRIALREHIRDGVLILLGATDGGLRSPFFQDSNFYYLTGWSEPGAVLVMTPSDEVLFLPRRDPEKEKWTGRRTDPGAKDISAVTGFEKVRPAETIESELAVLIVEAPRIYTLLNSPGAEKLKRLLPLREFSEAAPAIARLRMKKSEAEQALLRRSAEITVEAHRAAWNRLKPGLYEYQIAAVMAESQLGSGCVRPAYAPIIGSGANSTFLHYSDLSRRMDAGEVVLMDAGAECDYYAADVTRTLPVGGKFTARQREIYDIVLDVQRAVIAAVKPGMTLARQGPNSLHGLACDHFNRRHDAAGDGLCKYFHHGIGHHIGLDVHDPFDASAPLAAGMVITIEPGLYFPDEGVGVRIEDMVLVTEEGAEVLSDGLPKEPDALESILAGTRARGSPPDAVP